MGRSVSYPNRSEVVIYTAVDAIFEDDEYNEWATQDAWDNSLDSLVSLSLDAFPSLNECDEWLDDEDHAILENKLVYVGLSEYMGVATVWILPKDNQYYALGVTSANNMKEKLKEIVDSAFSVRLNKIGQFSNGEAVFSKAI